MLYYKLTPFVLHRIMSNGFRKTVGEETENCISSSTSGHQHKKFFLCVYLVLQNQLVVNLNAQAAIKW